MTIPSDILDEIWNQLESLYPSVVVDPIWDWYVESGWGEMNISAFATEQGWGDICANELLLILAAEGHGYDTP